MKNFGIKHLLSHWPSLFRGKPGLSLGSSSAVVSTRKRIAVWAIIIAGMAALIELPMPAEDAFKAARSELRQYSAPQDIVVVAIDERSLSELQVAQPTRVQDARLVERLFAAGAERVVFDRAYADPGSLEEDAAFAETLERHRGRVWLGASPVVDNGFHRHEGLLPATSLLNSTNVASMMGQSGPFGLSVRFPTATNINGREVPSISSVLAGYEGERAWYRPDLALDVRTIPTVSYVDVVTGSSAHQFAGKSVVVAPTHLSSKDFHNLPLGGKIAGVYFHVMGAHTLKGGVPIDLGWWPALLLVAGVLMSQIMNKRPASAVFWATMAGLPIAAVVLDIYAVNIDVFPAAIALAIGQFRLSRLAERTYSNANDLILRETLETSHVDTEHDVYALKLRNLDRFTNPKLPLEFGKFVENVIRGLQSLANSGAADQQVAFEKDTLIWLAPKVDRSRIQENAEGLVSVLLSGSLALAGHRLEVTLAVEPNREQRVRERIANAVQAAELASRQGKRCVMVDCEWLEERSKRGSLLEDLDRALEDGTIAVAYQPKIELATGTVIGAEALLRWEHPTLGLIHSPEVVAIAEEHERIDDLTSYVLDRAMADCRVAVRRNPFFKVAVNITASTLQDVMILYQIARLRSRHSFSAANLVLEITETAPLRGAGIQEHIEALSKEGITFSIDDFGTGHSALTNLGKVPSGELKIDRCFVATMRSSKESRAIVEATLSMARSFGKSVVAEGIEDELTAEALRQMGCDIGQGFLFSPAMPIENLIEMMETRRKAA